MIAGHIHKLKPTLGLAVMGMLCALTSQACAQVVADDFASWEADLAILVETLEAEHKDPYHHTSELEFQAAVTDFSNQLKEMDRSQRIAGLASIIALVGDGHTWMPMHRVPFDGMPPGPVFRSLPIRFDSFADGLFIVGATHEYENLLGHRVTAIGNLPVESATHRMLKLLPSDAVNFSAEMLPEWLMQAELLLALGISDSADIIKITMASPNKEETTVSLRPLNAALHYDWIMSRDTGPIGGHDWVTTSKTVPLWLEPYSEPARSTILTDAVYLQIQQIRDGSLSLEDIAIDAVQKSEALENPALIIDLRRAIGGNGDLNDALIKAVTSSKALMRSGRIAVLISRRTHSAAIMLVSALEQSTPAIFYGQSTADRPNHHGETNFFVLPNTGLPFLHASEYYQTSTSQDCRPYITPDVKIPELFHDFAAGNDPVLAAALFDLKG